MTHLPLLQKRCERAASHEADLAASELSQRFFGKDVYGGKIA